MSERPVVRWSFETTGEIKEVAMSGVDRGTDIHGVEYADEWESTALELALRLVPDLEAWIDMARMKGQSVTVAVAASGGETTPGEEHDG